MSFDQLDPYGIWYDDAKRKAADDQRKQQDGAKRKTADDRKNVELDKKNTDKEPGDQRHP